MNITHKIIYLDQIGKINGKNFRFRFKNEDGFARTHGYVVDANQIPKDQSEYSYDGDSNAHWDFADENLIMQVYPGRGVMNKVIFAQAPALLKKCEITERVAEVYINDIRFRFSTTLRPAAKTMNPFKNKTPEVKLRAEMNSAQFNAMLKNEEIKKLSDGENLGFGFFIGEIPVLLISSLEDGKPLEYVFNPESLIAGSMLASLLGV